MSEADTYGRRAQPARLDTPYSGGGQMQAEGTRVTGLRQAMQAADRPTHNQAASVETLQTDIEGLKHWVDHLKYRDLKKVAREIVGGDEAAAAKLADQMATWADPTRDEGDKQ